MFKKEERPNYFETILKLTIVLVVSVLVFVSPFLLYSSYAETGIMMYIVTLIMLSPSIAFTYKKLIYFKKDELKNAFTSSKTYIGILAILDCFIFFEIGLNTLVSTFWLATLYCVTNFPIYLFYKQKIGLIPTITFEVLISVLLLINYYTATNLQEEQYHYTFDRTNSTIYLENNKYEEYFGIRVFWTNREAPDFNEITYQIGEGILGYRVVKNFRFKPKK